MPAVRGPILAMGGTCRLNSEPATMRSTRSTGLLREAFGHDLVG